MSTKSSTAAPNTKTPLTRTFSNENNNTNNINDKKLQQVKYIASVVRALVTSRKPPCTLREILREYPEVESKPIPFKQLGFNSSEDLLRESGEFIFNRIGGETCITAKHNTKTAHIASMVRTQKSSKSTRITQVKQVRQPRRSDQSWNKSTFSSNIFQKLPPTVNRFIQSQNRANNNNYNINNNNNYQNNNRNNNNNNNAQQQQLQRQKSIGSGGGSNINNGNRVGSVAAQPKDLREVLNAKVQQNNNTNKDKNNNSNNNNNVANGQKDLRTLLNTKPQEQKTQQQQQNPQQKMQNGNKVDLRERLNSKLQQQQQREQEQNPNMPRAILGHNNGVNGAGPGAGAVTAKQQKQQQHTQQHQQQQQYAQPQKQQQHQQLLQNNTAIAIASSLILAQREQKNQEQRQQNRADLLSFQQQQQQKQQNQQNQQQSRSIYKPAKKQQQTPAAAAASAARYQNNTASVAAITSAMGNCSVQQRLSIKINNSSSNNRTSYASGGNSAESSPALSSAGSEQLQSPFGGGPQTQFNKQRFMSQQQHQAEEEPVIPPKVFQFNPKLDPITSLSQYCVVRNCSKPEYTIFKSKFSNLYQGRVLVNGTMFSTYPKEYLNEHMAQISCAIQAIDQIKAQEFRRPLPPCTDTDYELTEKIYNELLAHPHGMFAKNMTEWFETTYEQALPAHWWSLVQSSNKFITETAASNNVILFANLDFDKDDAQSLSSLSATTIIQMDGISLPWSQKCWNLYITHCASTVEVWARLFGKEYSEKFDNLMNDIEISMLADKVRPLAIANKQIYLVCISECWHRVRVEEMDKLNGTALCFFIDFGDADWLSVNQLYICDPKFLVLPSQAVPFSLFGLEDFAGNPYARRHLDSMLASKSVVGEILTKEADFYSSDSAKIQVVLYDTSSQDDVNLHPLILNQICDDTPPPKLNSTGVTNVLVTYVSDEGDLYLQILNSELKYVQKLVQQLIESKFKHDQHKVSRSDLKHTNLFLICDESDGGAAQPQWYRGALTERHYTQDDEEFDIFYVDNGQTRRTHISKIFRLESLSTALSKFPRQAIKARLYNIPDMNKSIVGRMRALLPANCEALVKMSTPSSVPSITAYRRIGGSDTLCTINDVIRIEHELEICSDAADGSTPPTDATKTAGIGGSSASISSLSPRNNSFVDMTRGLTITCATSVPNSPQKSGELPKLKDYEAIPPVGEYFEVRVTMSSNPSNFMLQPYKSYPKLRTMMKELQEYCENNDDFIPVDMVEIGQAYAAKNPDGFYHRVTVVNTYSGDMIHVCFCDFGDIAILRNDQLKILPAKFRVLPKMAIQAKLHGITARHVDWTLDDCLRFRELTVGQKFVSIIQRISRDKQGTLDAQILELDLVDVTTDEDIYIHELLLKEERAIVDDAGKNAHAGIH